MKEFCYKHSSEISTHQRILKKITIHYHLYNNTNFTSTKSAFLKYHVTLKIVLTAAENHINKYNFKMH